MMKSILSEFSDGFGWVTNRLLCVHDFIGPLCGSCLVAKVRFKTAALLAPAMLVAVSVADAATYYVATNGSDANSGDISAPFATFNQAVWQLKPGDTLYARAGIYSQGVYAYTSGTHASPITISSYPGESVVIDGGYSIPNSIIDVAGSNVTVQNMTLQRGKGAGIILEGAYDKALNLLSQSNTRQGILITGDGNYCVVSNCSVYCNSMINYQFTNSGWASGLSAAMGGFNSIIVNNRIWNTWGEGMSTYQCSNTTMIGNTVWDNKLNVYLSDCKYALLAGNLIYATPGNMCSNGIDQVGIELGDESYNPSSSDNTIINNLVLGCYNNFDSWLGAEGGGLVNDVIANNTFVNAKSANFRLLSGNHTNTIMANNIILQDNAAHSSIAYGSGSMSGLTFSHNLWSTNPPMAFLGTGDIIANPMLVESGLIGPGQLIANWFLLLSNSPAIRAAAALTVVSNDFFGMSRPQPPSIGAIEGTHLLQPSSNLHIISP